MQFVTFIERQPRWLVVLAALVLLALLGALDYVTGPWLSVLLLYSILIFGVAWFMDLNLALVFAALSAATWWWANKDEHPYGGGWGFAWATASRLASFIFVAVGGSALKTSRESDRQRIQALEHAKDLEREITRISEREQRRIGQDLHDGICQVLAAIRCAASSVRDDLAARSVPEAVEMGEIADMLKDAIVEIRNLARGIFPVQMEAAGLAAVLDELVETTRRLHRVQLAFEVHGDVKVSSPEVAMNLYRIAQEALSNAVKHSGSAQIVVSLTEAEGTLRLKVADCGGGFHGTPESKEGMGLKTMHYRADLIGAQLHVCNGPPGVTITCLLPLANTALPHS